MTNILYPMALILALTYMLIPLIANKINSLSLSTFLIFSGYGGNILENKNNNHQKKIIDKSTYLKNSFQAQSILSATLMLIVSFCYLIDINEIIMFLSIGIVGFIGTIVIGRFLKKYSIN